jgi:hypothetical protein
VAKEAFLLAVLHRFPAKWRTFAIGLLMEVEADWRSVRPLQFALQFNESDEK